MSRCLAEQKTVNFDCCLFQLLEKSQRPIFDHRVVELEIWNAPILKDLRCVKMSIVILLPVFQVMLIHHSHDMLYIPFFCLVLYYVVVWFPISLFGRHSS